MTPDPEAYARLWARLPATTDLGWWQEQAEESPDGRVLYLGAGAGRLALPIAEHCRSLVAVESSPFVAAILRERVAAHAVGSRVLVVEADVRGLPAVGAGSASERVGSPTFAGWFGRVLLPSNLLNQFLDAEERLAVLRQAARRCARDGRVVLQVLNPYWLIAGPPVEPGTLVPADGSPPLRVVVHRLEQWPWAQRHRLRLVYTTREATGPGDTGERMTDELDVVALLPADLRHLCRRAGLEIVERWGSEPGRSPLDTTGGTWHLVCRPLERG